MRTCRVSPFGHPRIVACLPAPRGFSQAPTSFIASRCLGIPHVPFVAYDRRLRSMCALTRARSDTLTRAHSRIDTSYLPYPYTRCERPRPEERQPRRIAAARRSLKTKQKDRRNTPTITLDASSAETDSETPKGGDPATGSPTATLLRLHPSRRPRRRRSLSGHDFGRGQLPWCDGRCVQGPGTYSPQHADLRLLAIPASWSRVADSNPN